MRKIDAAELGGTLFVPATHKYLEAIALGEKFPALRSVVFDTEDGIGDEALEAGIEAITTMLATVGDKGPLRFIRPRNPEVLKKILTLPGIEKIDGFILPKFGLENADDYLQAVGNYRFMPSIEGEELFDVAKLIRLRDILQAYQEQIILIRFGAEDMLRQLGLRRDCDMMLYDMCAPSQVIGNILTTFKPHGYDVSAPVYRCYNDADGYEKEVKRDLAEGLISKTIIHPSQIEPIERLYRVSEQDVKEARGLLESSEAVFAQNGTMAESKTQRPWAGRVLARGRHYGVV